MHPGGTKPIELSALTRTSLAVILCLAGTLCAIVCPWHLSPMEISAAQDPKILCLCQWRGRGAAASPGILAGTSHFHLHNGDCSTTTINPLWNIFRPGCADEGEMTGSLHIQTMQCLPAAATWCNWRSVGCFPREGSTDWVLWFWACWEQLLVQDTTILLPLNLFSFTAF